MRILTIFFISLTLVACGSDTQTPAAAEGPRCSGTVNLLANPEFTLSEESGFAGWSGSKHGSRKSFDSSINDGVFTVDRIGPEPWFTLSKSVDLSSYAGHQMLYKADLKLSLNSEGWTHAFEPVGGLQVLIWALSEPAILGTRLVYESSAEHSPNLGETDWFTAHVLFTVPERVKRTSIGVIMQANGSMSMRNPVLLDCGPAPESGA